MTTLGLDTKYADNQRGYFRIFSFIND